MDAVKKLWVLIRHSKNAEGCRSAAFMAESFSFGGKVKQISGAGTSKIIVGYSIKCVSLVQHKWFVHGTLGEVGGGRNEDMCFVAKASNC